MNMDQLLEKIGELLTNHTALLRKEIKESAEELKKELRADIIKSQVELRSELIKAQNSLRKEIVNSQEDTIQVLTDVIHESHGLLDKRIKKLEENLTVSPIQ